MPHSSPSSSVNDLSQVVRTGSCLCKAIKYTIKGEPLTMRVCHCENCKRATGSAFMSNLFFKSENIKIIQGEQKLSVYSDPETWNSSPNERVFCSVCGSNLFLWPTSKESIQADVKVVASGTVDGELPWYPRTELWPELRRHFIPGIENSESLEERWK